MSDSEMPNLSFKNTSESHQNGPRRHRSHSKKRRGDKQVKNLRRLIIITALFCLAYFTMYFILYASGDADKPDGFLGSDLNYILFYLLLLSYFINIAAIVKSFYFAKNYSASFNKYRFLGVFITIVLLLFLLLSLSHKEQTSTNEFMQEEVEE